MSKVRWIAGDDVIGIKILAVAEYGAHSSQSIYRVRFLCGDEGTVTGAGLKNRRVRDAKGSNASLCRACSQAEQAEKRRNRPHPDTRPQPPTQAEIDHGFRLMNQALEVTRWSH